MEGRHPATRRGVGRGPGSKVRTQLEAGCCNSRRPREHVQTLRDGGTGAGRCVGRRLQAVSQSFHLLLDPASAFFELRRLHGGSPTSCALTRLGVWVDHPPRRLTRALILHTHEAVVKREVVADRVLQHKVHLFYRFTERHFLTFIVYIWSSNTVKRL